MNYYIDIKVKPDADMRENVLLNKVYTKFHETLFVLDTTSIGVSFPKYQIKLGNILRIHSTISNLETLEGKNWLGPLADYCDVSPIFPIPKNVSHRTVSRKQTNMSPAKLRRLIKRGTITVEEAKNYKAKMFTQSLANPYLELESASNGHKHRRFIEFGAISSVAVQGNFDKFGLSKSATIPWF